MASKAKDEKKPKDDHIKVVVRSRPLNAEEKAAQTPMLVTCDQDHNQVNVTMNNGSKRGSKKYAYDMVFGQHSTQAQVYNAAIRPVVDEVLLGYNCTVFAYGQTGTGKTYTMEGDLDNPEMMGMIPRAVVTIFDALNTLEETEYTVKVSFLELYNEELQDLLSPTDDVKLRILDDKSRMSTGVSCHNLEEVMVKTPADILNVMKKALAKRQVGETKLNKASSRSHCIFTMTVHMREVTPDGEDLLKIGKLNLVDLAGSECIGRSGAKNQRAREAGNINKSLLTLGRVISALVEKTPHVPYRDSKLTRLLQESLGGRAKTCIIATVAPSVQCLDETLSTLEYASRAKSIKNKPEANQRMTKRTLMREYAEDVERLRQELASARAKDGVYLDEERYNNMVLKLEQNELEVAELEEIKSKLEAEQAELEETLEETQNKLSSTEEELEDTKEDLEKTREDLAQEKVHVEEEKIVVQAHESTESKLRGETQALHVTLEDARVDVGQLHAKVLRKERIERENENATHAFEKDAMASLQTVSNASAKFCSSQLDHHTALRASVIDLSNEHAARTKAILDAIRKLGADARRGVSVLAEEQVPRLRDQVTARFTQASEEALAHHSATETALGAAKAAVDEPLVELVEKALAEQDARLAAHTASLQAQIESASEKARAFAEMQAGAIDKLSAQITADADANRRALRDQQAGFDAHVATERERLEESTSTLLEQFTAMLGAFKSEAVASLESVQSSTQGASQAAIQAVAESERTAMMKVADIRTRSKEWCAGTTTVMDELVSEVVAGKDELAEHIETARALGKCAAGAAAEHVASLAEAAGAARDATKRLCAEAASEVADKADSIQVLGQELVVPLEEGEEELESKTTALESHSVGWLEKRKEDSQEQSTAIESFSAGVTASVGSLQDRTRTFVHDDLRRDQSTAATPRRNKSYSYSLAIAKTNAREAILAPWREAKAAKAADAEAEAEAEAAEAEAAEAEDSPQTADAIAEHFTIYTDSSVKPVSLEGITEDGLEVSSPTPTATTDAACSDLEGQDGEDAARSSDSAGEDGEDDVDKAKPRAMPMTPLQSAFSEPLTPRAELGEISGKVLNVDAEQEGGAAKCPATPPDAGASSADDEDAALDHADVMAMKVTELRKELVSRNLSALGNKATLQARLLEGL